MGLIVVLDMFDPLVFELVTVDVDQFFDFFDSLVGLLSLSFEFDFVALFDFFDLDGVLVSRLLFS